MKTMIPNISNINKKTLLIATFNMHKTMETYGINNYEPSNFKKENLKIFKKETEEFNQYKYYNALSLISIMFIDLGIIS